MCNLAHPPAPGYCSGEGPNKEDYLPTHVHKSSITGISSSGLDVDYLVSYSKVYFYDIPYTFTTNLKLGWLLSDCPHEKNEVISCIVETKNITLALKEGRERN